MPNYLAEGLQSGFQSGLNAMTQRLRDKKQAEDQKARDVLQAEQQKQLQSERIVADANRDFKNNTWRSGESELERISRSDEAAVDRSLRSSEFTKRAEAEQADRALKSSLYFDQQSRQDEQATVDRALKAPLMAEQVRGMKLQNDAYGQPKPIQPMETLEYDPLDPTAAPKRRVTGPLGSLGAPTTAPAAKPASVIDSFLTTPGAAAPDVAPAPAPAPTARPEVFPAPPGKDANMQKLLRQLGGLPPAQMAEELAAAGIELSPAAFRRPTNRTF